MKTVGIIAEYNPFHEGHRYQIEKAKELTGADYVIATMSGSFVQRGEPAITDKYTRTRMALQNGVDAVFELPVCFSLGSAPYFAEGAIMLLDSLGVTDFVCFGSESGDISLLKECAQTASEDSDITDEILSGIRSGQSFAQARSEALSRFGAPEISMPNDILGCEYCRALEKRGSKITPVTLKREGAAYHEERLDDTHFPSAAAIRNKILDNYSSNKKCLEGLENSMPKDALSSLSKASYLPLTADAFSQLLWYRISSCTVSEMSEILDINDQLARRIKNTCGAQLTFLQLAQEIKSRQYTLTRIKRSLFHLLLDIRSTEVHEMLERPHLPYARLLGMKRTAAALMRQIQSQSSSLIITKLADAPAALDTFAQRMLERDIFAAQLCARAAYDTLSAAVTDEYKISPVIIS